MGIFFRKSFKLGPFRLNLSKSGVGVSTGVKGARIGMNAKGQTYVAGGRSGIYFRKNLGTVGNEHNEHHTDEATGTSVGPIVFGAIIGVVGILAIAIVALALWFVFSR